MSAYETRYEISNGYELPFTRKKEEVVGSEWSERKKEERNKERKGDNIFGTTLIKNWEIANKTGAAYEVFSEIDYGPVMEERLIASHNKLVEKEVNNAHKSLVKVAKKNPEMVKDFISSFFLKNPILASDLARLVPRSRNKADIFLGRKRNDINAVDVVSDHIFQQYRLNIRPDFLTTNKENPLFIDMLRNHREVVFEREKALLAQTEQYRVKLLDMVRVAIADGSLPTTIERAEQRINEARVMVLDGFIGLPKETGGDYDARTHTIRISSHISPETVWHVYVHEMVHALSGQMEVVDDYNHADLDRHDIRRIGVSNNHQFFSEFESLKFSELNWLNEALTERLSMRMVGEEHDLGVYLPERKLLSLLIEKGGFSEKMLYEAYFEDYNMTVAKGESPHPALKKMYTLVNERFGNRFLVDLDLCVHYLVGREDVKNGFPKGVGYIVSEWQQRGDSFPDFIHKEAVEIRKMLTVREKQMREEDGM